MLVWLVLLVIAAVIAGFVWNYRRQAAAREAASAERMKAFLEQSRGNNATAAPAAPPDSVKDPVAKPAERHLKAPPNVTGYALRAPLLNSPQRTLFHLLRVGLPEHEVFACVSLAAFIQPDNLTGFAREAQERRLADAVVDFVVCDKSMKAVVAVQCGARSGKAAENAAFAAACIASTGLRWVEISPDVLPQRDEIRQRVLGV